MLSSAIWLRIAAVLTLVHAVLHTIGGVLAQPAPGVAATVANTMRENQFKTFGATRSYADFHEGLGWALTIFLLVGAVVFWQLGTIASDHAALLRPVLVSFMLAYLAFAVVSYRFFFWGPVVAELLIATCVLLAIIGAARVPLDR